MVVVVVVWIMSVRRWCGDAAWIMSKYVKHVHHRDINVNVVVVVRLHHARLLLMRVRGKHLL